MTARWAADGPLVVVVNRRAGGIDRLEEALAVIRASRDAVVVEVTDRLALDELLDEVAGRTIVAAGGDGSLQLLAQRLWHRGVLADVELGLLPLGTGNDLARAVGIPLDPRAAASVVVSGHPRPLDLLVDDSGTVALNAVHCGVGGVAVQAAAPLKPLVGRLAYRLGAALAGAREPGWQVSVELDDRLLVEGSVLFIGIGNGATIGGGALLWPDARPDDGLAEVIVAAAAGTLSRLKLVAALRSGHAEEADGVVVGNGASVHIRGQPIPYIVDGEAIGSSRDRSWEIRPAAWRLLVPAAAR